MTDSRRILRRKSGESRGKIVRNIPYFGVLENHTVVQIAGSEDHEIYGGG